MTRFSCVLLLIAFSLPAKAYELFVIQAVSATKKTFVTRNGQRQGVVQNMTATFTADDVALIAKAKTVTSQFTQWEVVNPEAQVPFSTGTIVTYHPAQEYLWSLNPEEARRRYITEARPESQRSWLMKGATTRGLTESVSGTTAETTSRGGVAMDVLFEYLFHPNFAWDVGLRYEREIVNLPGGSLITQRAMLVADVLYYLNAIESFYDARFYLGLGFGVGQSSTSADGKIQSGQALLLPAAKLGVSLPVNKKWDFLLESAFETLKTDERLENKTRQATNQTNFRLGVGLRKSF